MSDKEKEMFQDIKKSNSIENRNYDLNEWESGFVNGLKEEYNLSVKQHACLKKIWDKI